MKTLQVYSNSNAHEDAVHHYYNIIKDNDQYTLRTSDSSDWTVGNEWRASLLDDGDGVLIRLGDGGIHLNYSEAYELLVLLLVSQEDRIKIVEQTTILEL